jgi:peptide/nickel transport system permease protein
VKESSLPPDWFTGKARTDLGAVGKHPLGTDTGGKDVLTTLLYGTRISITIGVLAVAIYVTIGIILGSLAGYFGGWVDILASRLIEVFICLPGLFFILTIIAVFETRSIFLIMLAIGLLGWTRVARLVRGEFLTQRGQDYVTAAEGLGIPKRRIIFRHVLPNALTPVLVSATFGVAAAILTESSIAFLGLGDPDAASWGVLLDKGRNTQYEWLILPPGVAIFFTVTAFNMLGEGLRDALDPKLRQ